MSKIEWTGETWNPIAGCSIVSPGCTNCYAMRTAARLEAMDAAQRKKRKPQPAGTQFQYGDDLPLRHYRGLTVASKAGPVWSGKVALAPDNILTEPLHRRKPVTYFVNSMSDLFHEDVTDEWIDRVFAVMALTPHHTFQILTKRAQRMREYFASERRVSDVIDAHGDFGIPFLPAWPLPNVWLGVSTERQSEADERIPLLLDTPAQVRFISAEPLLGAVDLVSPVYHDATGSSHRGYLRDKSEPDDFRFNAPKLDWVIVGGESGRGARPMHPDWARQLRDQCAAAGVPFFLKQMGCWAVTYDRDRDDPDWRKCDFEQAATPNGEWLNLAGGQGFHGARVVRVVPSKERKGGRTLDGATHSDTPATREPVLCK